MIGHRQSRRILALAIWGVLATSAPVRAATLTWDGGGTAGGGDEASWFDSLNWNPNGIPNASTDVVIGSGFASGHTIVLIQSANANSLTINTTTAFSIFSPNGTNFLAIAGGNITRNDVAGTEADQFINTGLVLGHDGVWNIGGSNTLTVGRVMESVNGVSLTKTGSGTLILTVQALLVAPPYSGGTIINDGVVRLVDDGAAGSGAITINSGGVLSFDGAAISNHIDVAGSGSGNGAIRSISTGRITGTVHFSANTSIGVNDGADLTISGVINDGSSTFALSKLGNGTLILNAANTYAGLTNISAGTLEADNNGSLGTSTSVFVASLGSLRLNGGLNIANKTLFTNGAGLSGEGALHSIGAQDNTWAGDISMNASSTIGVDDSSLTVGGVISGASSLVKSGNGKLILPGANTYTGGTNITAGSLRIRNDNALGGGVVFIANGASLELQETLGSAPISVSRTIHIAGKGGAGSNGAFRNISSNNNWLGGVALDADSTIGVDAGTLTVSGATSGAFNLTKVGPGTLIFTSAANNHADTIVDGGILGITNPNALPFGRNITVHSGGMAEFQSAVQMNRALNLNGSGVSNLGALHSLSGNASWIAPLTLQSDSSIGVDAGELRVTAAVGGTGGLTKVGNGKLSLTSANTYTGTTTVSSGVLSLENSAAIPAASATTVASGGEIDLRGGIAPAAALSLSGIGILNAGALRNVLVNNTYAGPITLASGDATVGADPATTLTISGVISDGTSASPLTKVGAGTLILTNANTYRGGTFINGGTLQISADNNLGAAPGSVTSNNGGKLVVAANAITSRTFNLNTGSLQVNSGAILRYDNATVNGGFLRGPGTHQINTGSSFNGVTALNGNSIIQSQPTTLTNFTNAGSILSSSVLTWDGGFNTPAGNITVNSAFNTQAFENDGIITINAGGNVTNTSSSFVSGAGGRITINPGAQLNAGPSLELSGSLLVNNGTVSGITNVNFGSLAKGAGTYGAVNVTDGGKFSPGNSPGSVTTGSTTWNSGGSYVVEIADALAGAGTGWDEWNIDGSLNLNATNSTNGRFTISLSTLDALAADFDNTHNFDWTILHADGGIAGFDPSRLNLDTSAFRNSLAAGHFSLESTSNDLIIHFSAVPEPFSVTFFCVISVLAANRRRFHR